MKIIKKASPSHRAQRGRYVKATICLRLPLDADLDDVADYLENAISSHRGSLDPHDPMFELEPKYISMVLERQSQPTRLKEPSQ